MKRQNNRGRKQAMNNGQSSNSRNYESTGPDIKIKGNPNQIYEKYIQLGRDASANGDRVKMENYYQHADHYFRLKLKNVQETLKNENEKKNSFEEKGNHRTDKRKLKSGREANENNKLKPVKRKPSSRSKSNHDSKQKQGEGHKTPDQQLLIKKEMMTGHQSNASKEALEIVKTEASELVSEIKSESQKKKHASKIQSENKPDSKQKPSTMISDMQACHMEKMNIQKNSEPSLSTKVHSKHKRQVKTSSKTSKESSNQLVSQEDNKDKKHPELL